MQSVLEPLDSLTPSSLEAVRGCREDPIWSAGLPHDRVWDVATCNVPTYVTIITASHSYQEDCGFLKNIILFSCSATKAPP